MALIIARSRGGTGRSRALRSVLVGTIMSRRTVLDIMARRAKLFGLDAPIAVAVGISEAEFGRQVAELLTSIDALGGPGASARELARELAWAVPEPAHALPSAARDDDAAPWSNIGAPEHGYLTDEPEPEVVVPPEDEPEPEVVRAARGRRARA